MSHELRTPLHAILGMSDLLRATRLNIEQQEMVRTVRSAGQTLLDMIDDVLDIAKIEAGSVEAQSMEFDLHEVLATVRTLLHHQAVGKGLALQLNLDAAAPYRLMGASRSLRQILVNLVANAIKFTDHGSITIKVSEGAFKQQRGDALRIEVRDTGVGIPADAQVRIFERFTQGDESTTRTHGGAGLGLAIAHELATLMGGTLEVRSSLGSGTCFVLQLQFARLSDEAPRRLDGRVVVVGPPSQIEAYSRRLTTR
ncbi:MAG: ATP-binding protein, partial [Nitrospirota bacterium]|nr:ATP-binding protein [Nitrospirota bacterium]